MKKKLLCVFLSLLTTSTLWAADGDTFTANTVEGVEMTFKVISESEKTCQVGPGDWTPAISTNISGAITIPSEVNGYVVKEIGSDAFYYCSDITSITIPEGVTSIGDYAFNDCYGLTSITITEGVTSIGSYAFSGCTGLTSITIPESVTSIGSYTFYGCSSLTNITIPVSVTSIGSNPFMGCNSLTSVTSYIENPPYFNSDGQSVNYSLTLYVPKGTDNTYRSMGWDSYFGNIEEMQEPDVIIDFADNLVKELCVSNWDTNGDGELSTSEAKEVKSLSGVFFNETNILSFNELQYFVGLESIESNAFGGCEKLSSITIPESVIEIEDMAFYLCGLTSITIPNSVTSIGGYAFQYCGSLTSVTIPNSVTTIGYEAFKYCGSLTSVTIPKSVTSIEGGAFSDCSGLTSITVESGNTEYDSRENCNAIIETSTNKLIVGCQNTTIPNSVTSIGDYAFEGFYDLTSITIPNSVLSIGYYAFKGCYGLTSITIPNSVMSIESTAFFETGWYENQSNGLLYLDNWLLGYKGIEPTSELMIEEGTTGIAGGAFRWCNNLTSVTIPNSVTSIGESAFGYCSGLTSVTIPNSVTSIGQYAFDGCSGLTSITIPNSVTSIGSYAFSEYLNTVVILNENPESMNSNSYAFEANRETLYVPQGTKEGYTSIWGSQFEKIIELADADVTLGKNVVSFASEQMLDFSTPIEDLKAYIVSGISSDGMAIINEVTGAVPSGTGLILKGTAGHSYTIPYTTTVPDAVSNMLIGVTEDTEIGGNDLDYILSDGKFVKASYGTLPAGKAYLKLDEALARSVITIGDEITGIKTIDGAPIAAERYYNLNGQRVSTPQKGLYIVNGKKVAKK